VATETRTRRLLDTDSGFDREASNLEVEAQVARTGRAYTVSNEADPSSRIWDVVDEMWTSELRDTDIFSHYLRKMVAKCSACRTTHFTPEQIVSSHIVAVRRIAEEHINAEAVFRNDVGGGFVCTGCGTPFSRGSMQARKHIEEAKANGPRHDGATGSWIKRFVLEPSVTPSPAVLAVVGGSEELPRERSRPHRRRGRRRRGRR